MGPLMKRRNQKQIIVEAALEGFEHEHECPLSFSWGECDQYRQREQLAGIINFEMFKQMSDDHSDRKIPTQNQEMLRKHEIDDEFENINSNAF